MKGMFDLTESQIKNVETLIDKVQALSDEMGMTNDEMALAAHIILSSVIQKHLKSEKIPNHVWLTSFLASIPYHLVPLAQEIQKILKYVGEGNK